MARSVFFALLVVSVSACAPSSDSSDEAIIFVARLGADTVAVERVVYGTEGVDMILVTRVPETRRTEARLDLDAENRMLGFSTETNDAEGQVLQTLGMTWDQDTLRVQSGDAAARRFAAGQDALPFIEYAHAPFDLALRRGTAGPLPMATSRSVLDFTVTRDGDAATVRHPFRGPMAVRLASDGGLAELDAAETTRKLVVTRAPGLDVDAFQRRAAALDDEGRGLGPLSGRAEAEVSVGGATIVVDHGQPSLRGRRVWGTVVPYGSLWRTGADRATHLTTDRPLVLGSGGEAVRIPAGTVTLFSVPEPDGGVLIVSEETGQNGNSYDPEQDLGRVPFMLDSIASPVEQLEIVAEPDGDAGRLVIRWGDRALSVPFRVE